MFRISHDGVVIGCSALEKGDPPMGCAGGTFVPNPEFERFRENVIPQTGWAPEHLQWPDLSASTQDGTTLNCVDVILSEFDFGDEIELVVDVLGISDPSYETLFPGRYADYEASFANDKPTVPVSGEGTPVVPETRDGMLARLWRCLLR